MAGEELDLAQREHDLYLDERKQLIDAARESARTFDKAVLTFGSAVFGFSIAFLKDIAPNPAQETLKWLGASWFLFSTGLLAILLSFLFSHRACMSEIEEAGRAITVTDSQLRKKNPWSTATHWCNFLCIAFLFFGLLCWSIFAFDNLRLRQVVPLTNSKATSLPLTPVPDSRPTTSSPLKTDQVKPGPKK